jgi:hypothetical protein
MLGSICLHALFNLPAGLIRYAIQVIVGVLEFRPLRSRACIRQLLLCLNGILRKIEYVSVSNFVMSSKLNGSYWELSSSRIDIKNAKYDSIMETDKSIDMLVTYISLGLSLISAMLQLILDKFNVLSVHPTREF